MAGLGLGSLSPLIRLVSFQHVTLSRDDVLTVKYGELTYRLRIFELRPSTSISVLETDIKVDIANPGVESERTCQYVLKSLVFGASKSGSVREGKYMHYKFSIDDDTWERIASNDVKIEVKIDAETNGGDTDLYVSRHSLIFPNRQQHEWSFHDVGSKPLILTYKDRNLGAGLYSLALYGFKGIWVPFDTGLLKGGDSCINPMLVFWSIIILLHPTHNYALVAYKPLALKNVSASMAHKVQLLLLIYFGSSIYIVGSDGSMYISLVVVLVVLKRAMGNVWSNHLKKIKVD